MLTGHVLHNRIILDHEGPARPEMEIDIISSAVLMETLPSEEATGLFIINPVHYKEPCRQALISPWGWIKGSVFQTFFLALANKSTLNLCDIVHDFLKKLPGGQLVHLSSGPTRLLMRF